MTAPLIFGCPVCRVPITRPVRPLTDDRLLLQDDWTQWVPPGYVREGPPFPDLAGLGWTMSVRDLVHTRCHPEPYRSIGCCGPSFRSESASPYEVLRRPLPNRVCAYGHDVAVEYGDCMGAHWVALVADCVVMKAGYGLDMAASDLDEPRMREWELETWPIATSLRLTWKDAPGGLRLRVEATPVGSAGLIVPWKPVEAERARRAGVRPRGVRQFPCHIQDDDQGEMLLARVDGDEFWWISPWEEGDATVPPTFFKVSAAIADAAWAQAGLSSEPD